MLLKPLPDNDAGSVAEGINNRGDVVGNQEIPGINLDGHMLSIRWNAASSLPRKLNFRPHEAVQDLNDISDDGLVYSGLYTSGLIRPFRFSNGLDLAYDDAVQAQFVAASDSGTVLMDDLRDGWTDEHASVLLTAKGAQELATPAGIQVKPKGITPNGRVVWATDGRRSVIWTDGVAKVVPEVIVAMNDRGDKVIQNGTSYTLVKKGGPTTPLTGGEPSRINNAGQVIQTDHQKPRVWIDGKAHDLNDLIAGRSGYTILWISDINASGQVVGAAELANGKLRGFVATPSNGTTIYSAPGYHEYNGRKWNTNCEPYSQTVRCRTEIWATQVSQVGGKFVPKTGWFFNNLTYLPFMTRAAWAKNPLGHTGEFTGTDGRKWRTECDTPATGRNACRSYAWSTFIASKLEASGNRTYYWTSGWVFNNIVRFK